MSQPNQAPLRYFKARLKPFSNPVLWAPPAILALLAVSVWQYQIHPEWRNTALEQLPPANPGEAPNNSAANTQPQPTPGTDSQLQNWNSLLSTIEQQAPLNPKTAPTTKAQEQKSPGTPEVLSKNLFDQMQEKQKSQPNQLFAPLIPQNNANSDLLNRAALKDNNALLKGSPQGTNTTSDNANSTARAFETWPLWHRPNNSQGGSTGAPLQQAMEQTFSGNGGVNRNGNNANLTPQVPANANATNYSPGVPSTANRYGVPPTQAIAPTNPYTIPYLGQPQSGTSSLSPLPTTQRNLAGFTPQNQFNQPGAALNPAYAPTNRGLQPGQIPTQQNQNQFNQPNYNTSPNPYGFQTPNIRQPVQTNPQGY